MQSNKIEFDYVFNGFNLTCA